MEEGTEEAEEKDEKGQTHACERNVTKHCVVKCLYRTYPGSWATAMQLD